MISDQYRKIIDLEENDQCEVKGFWLKILAYPHRAIPRHVGDLLHSFIQVLAWISTGKRLPNQKVSGKMHAVGNFPLIFRLPPMRNEIRMCRWKRI